MASPSEREFLQGLREVQASRQTSRGPAVRNATAPDLCLAASKYVAGKLIGLFRQTSHLNELIQNLNKHERIAPAMSKRAWGGSLSANKYFNEKILPSSLGEDGGVAETHTLNDQPIFDYSTAGNIAHAERLLTSGAPLVIGVSLHGKGQRDHFICIVRNTKTGSVWAIDSWEDGIETTTGVAELKGWTSFTQRYEIDMDAGPTVIPCNQFFLGYYRGQKSRKAFPAICFGAANDNELMIP